VQGSELYEVEISWRDDGSPDVSCTCPYDWEPLCKHAVAALLHWQGGDGDRGEAIDLSGFVKAIGALTGNFEITRGESGSLKVGIEERDGEIKFTLKRPPAEFISGMKNILSGFSKMLDAFSLE